jgi:transcriptional regulator with XRE-family HTH domain
MSITQQELARRIRLAREACRMTEEDAANHLAVSRSIFAQIEAGNRSASGLELEKLAYLFGRDIREFVADRFWEQDALAALFRAQSDMAGQPAVIEKLRECMAIGRELTNLERLVGIDRDLAGFGVYPMQLSRSCWEAISGEFKHRFLGLALEAFRRDEISRGKFRELASMVGLGRSDLDRLVEFAGIGE